MNADQINNHFRMMAKVGIGDTVYVADYVHIWNEDRTSRLGYRVRVRPRVVEAIAYDGKEFAYTLNETWGGPDHFSGDGIDTILTREAAIEAAKKEAEADERVEVKTCLEIVG